MAMYKLRIRYLNRLGVDEQKLTPYDKQSFKCRFRDRLNALEGIYIMSEKSETDKGTPLRLIHYLTTPHQP